MTHPPVSNKSQRGQKQTPCHPAQSLVQAAKKRTSPFSDKDFSDKDSIILELRRITTPRLGPLYAHFFKAVNDAELAPNLMLSRRHNPVTGVTTHSMVDTRTGNRIT